jgi:sugar O-acyltransferase (sialic acid O-acetyltransferase NeuD family)
MTKQKLILIGGGGHCKSCIDVIEMQNKYEISGILDLKENFGKSVLGYKIIGSDEDFDGLIKADNIFIIAIGQIRNVQKRISLFTFLKYKNALLATIISPLAYVSKHAIIGEGTIVMHHAIVNSSAIVGNNCIINSKALIEHDVVIGDHCHISTGAIVNGGVKVNNATFFGSGAVSKEYIEISENSFIKANSIVK